MNRRNTKHGLSRSRIYRTWRNMRIRCYYPEFIEYDRYGGRGIEVCPEWMDNFLAFYDWSIANGYADDLSIDRINVDGNYCPDNCRWVSTKVQQNNRCNNRYLTHLGKTQTVAQWAEELGINESTIGSRLFRGYTVDEALAKKADISDVQALIDQGYTVLKACETLGVSKSAYYRKRNL